MANKNKIKKVIHSILIVIICGFLVVGLICFYTLRSMTSKVKSIENGLKDSIINIEPTTIYDKNGNIISEVGAESREIVTYEQIPQVTIDAFLAIEDSRYFNHNGFDLPRFIASAFNNLKSGSFGQGGSTLTMQTIDNFIIKPKEEKDKKDGIEPSSLQRIESKIQEIYLSLRLDSMMNKEEILTAYLNKINFGYTTRGIQRGAQYYFGKDVEDLNLSESAFLAGVINAPNRYNPYNGYVEKTNDDYYQYALDRRNDTLAQMLNHGFISKSEYRLAKSTKLAFQLHGGKNTGESPYQGYINAVLQEAREITGQDPATTPMEIYTALDTAAQDDVNLVMDKEIVTMPDNKYYQVATSIINNKTGEIVAIGSGFDDPYSNTYRDRAINERHQPGSTVKPLVDYALAFDELGWCTSRVIEDEPLEIYGSTKRNYDNQYHGKVSINRAIAQSLNIPAFKTLQAVVDELGYDYMRSYMKKLGFDESVAEKFDLLFAIGGANFTASPTQMAGAYSMFANGGTYIEPHTITKIVYKNNNDSPKLTPTKTKVISPQAAYMISNLLYSAVHGEWSNYNYMSSAFAGANYPVYGKTGTSDWGEFAQSVGGSVQDIWMVNYTSEYTVATWTGFDSRVNGYTYISPSVQGMNIPGRINRYLLDCITTSNAKMLERPSGISDYGGGLIKTEFIDKAGEINPETEENVVNYTDELQKLIDELAKLDASKYTQDSYQALQQLLQQAKDQLANNTDKDQDTIKATYEALQSAYEALVEASALPGVDTSALQASIQQAYPYTDTSLYQEDAIAQLWNAITNATDLLARSDLIQAEVDICNEALQNAIQNCKNHPLSGGQPQYDMDDENEDGEDD